MSQQRTRKAVGAEPVSRSRAASGNVASNVQPKQRQRSRSKTKIPKMLRYDLENALVGLCDVWFGEIKPHLVRNNIKLHVHGELTSEEPASGDHRQLPLGAPGCSHIDPGAASDLRRHPYASFADFCSTQPTASTAQSRRPLAPPPPACPSQVSSPVKLHTSFNQNPCQSCKPKKRRRRCRHEAPLPQPEWRVPRLCRTYSLLTHTPRALPRQRPATEYHLQHQPRKPSATKHHLQHQPMQRPATEYHLQHQPRQRPATEYHLQHQPMQCPATEHHLQHQPRQRPATEHHLQHQPRQRPAAEHHLHHQYKYSPLYQRRRPKMIDKSTQTTSLLFFELHQTRPQAPPTRHLQNSSAPPRKQHKKRQSIPHQFYFANNDLRTQEIPQQMRFSDPTAASIRCSGTRTLLPNERSRQAKHQLSNLIRQDAELRAGNTVELTRRVPPAACPLSLQSNAFTTRKQNKKRQSIPHHSEFAVQDLAVRRELSQGTASSAACPRCPATTTLSKHQKRHPQPPPALFQDDLIDIIAEKKDKKLRLLFKSPPRDEVPSIMNLMHPVHARCNPKAIKKVTPWR